MRMEIWLLLATVFVLGNMYYDGKWTKMIAVNQKYVKMAGVLVAAYTVYWVFRGNPNRQSAAQIAAGALRELDLDASQQLAPLLDRVARTSPSWEGGHATGLRDAPARPGTGERAHRRSVSESKKKFVAASQEWCCGHCRQRLEASYEVDHIVRLDRGGSNEVENLVALCRNCHGRKTSRENM